MSVIPYLTFGQDCFEAMTFYAEVFDTKIDTIMRAHETPNFEVPEDQKDLIAHMSIKVAGGEIYASDTFFQPPSAMSGCSVMVSLADAAQSEAAFNRLAEGGTVSMAFAKTFWSPGFGTLTDRFGTRWMISTLES